MPFATAIAPSWWLRTAARGESVGRVVASSVIASCTNGATVIASTVIVVTVVAGLASPAHAQPQEGSAGASAECRDQAAWARAVTARGDLVISVIGCRGGAVQLRVPKSKYDFDVGRSGFRRTRDGRFGVSPIADLDWNDAPSGSREALESVVRELERDGSLLLPGPGAVPPPRAAGALSVLPDSPNAVSHRRVVVAIAGAVMALSVFVELARRRK